MLSQFIASRWVRPFYLLAVVQAGLDLPNPSGEAVAAEPQLQFDFARAIACRDVTPPDFAEVNPDRRIVECTLRLSVYLTAGDVEDVESLRVELADCDRRLRVHDFSPQTRLESALADNIEWTKSVESSHTLGASLGGELPIPGGDFVAHVTPSASTGIGGREVVTERQLRVAPLQAVVASGTIDREHGVFFTLRKSPTGSLEGLHELSVQFVVPEDWRGDAVRVTCRATGEQKLLWMKQQRVWAELTRPVALYQTGDDAARMAAEKLVRQ